ncbi:MAG: undecaprenyl-diphosphate phosphatase [bacterium]
MTNTLLTAILAGAVEGITEFLPVSSTGHLLLTEELLDCHLSDLFNIVIQSGAVLAVLPLFRERLCGLATHWRERASQVYVAKLALAFLVTVAGGLVLDRCGFKLPEKALPVALALLAGGIGFVVVESLIRKRTLTRDVTWTIALAVGAAQLLAAVFPGTSRSGATILLALLLGLGRVEATEFSFLVGIPTMLAAGGWKILHAVRHPAANALPEGWGVLAIGLVVAAAVSFVVVKWLLGYVRTHTFTAFGWYRIGMAALILGLLAGGFME